MHKRFLAIALLALVPISLLATGCQATTKSTSASRSTTSKASQPVNKDITRYLASLKAQALPVQDQQVLTGNALKKEQAQDGVELLGAVAFTNDHGVAMKLFITKTQEDATALREHFATAKWQVTSDASQRLVFIADRQLSKTWFEKYKQAIFRS